MEDQPNININPLKFFVFSLSISFIIGELLNLKISIPYIINLIGLFFLFIFIIIFFVSARMFFLHNEKLLPSTSSYKIIKTGIYSYTRNPIYLSFVGFQLGMFLLFENVIYFFSSIILFYWIHFFVVTEEESYLTRKFGEKYSRYKANVSRWL